MPLHKTVVNSRGPTRHTSPDAPHRSIVNSLMGGYLLVYNSKVALDEHKTGRQTRGSIPGLALHAARTRSTARRGPPRSEDGGKTAGSGFAVSRPFCDYGAKRMGRRRVIPVEMTELRDFAGIFPPVEGLLRAPKMGQRGKKETAASGNEKVFRGSVQHLRVVFSRNRRAAGPARRIGTPLGRIGKPHL